MRESESLVLLSSALAVLLCGAALVLPWGAFA